MRDLLRVMIARTRDDRAAGCPADLSSMGRLPHASCLWLVVASAAALQRPGGRDRPGEGPELRCRRERLGGIRIRGPSGKAGFPTASEPRSPPPRPPGSSRAMSPAGSAAVAPVRVRTADAVAPGRRGLGSGTPPIVYAEIKRRGQDPSSCRSSPGSRSARATGWPSSRWRAGRTGAGVARRQAGHSSRPARGLVEALAPDRDRRVVERRPSRLQLVRLPLRGGPHRGGDRGVLAPVQPRRRVPGSRARLKRTRPSRPRRARCQAARRRRTRSTPRV